jgi:hypothetical protein
MPNPTHFGYICQPLVVVQFETAPLPNLFVTKAHQRNRTSGKRGKSNPHDHQPIIRLPSVIRKQRST